MNDVFQVLLNEMNLDFYTRNKEMVDGAVRKRREATQRETPPLTDDIYWSKGEFTA